MAGAISQPRKGCQFLFCLMKNPLLYRGRLGRRAVGRQAKGFLWRRSVELRASGTVGLRWQAVFGCHIVWNRSTRRAGARGGARDDRPRWLRILTITGGSSMAAQSCSENSPTLLSGRRVVLLG